MEKELLLKLADRIERHKELELPSMNMDAWLQDELGLQEDFGDIEHRLKNQDHPWCGTSACICGHAAIMMFEDGKIVHSEFEIADWLGLDLNTRKDLFRGHAENTDISAQDASKVIRHLVETDEVDWDIIRTSDKDPSKDPRDFVVRGYNYD